MKEDLRSLVQSRLDELGISMRQAAKDADHAVSYELLSALKRGNYPFRLSERGAEGLSRALRVPVSRVWEAAAVHEPWQWPSRFNTLEVWQREIVELVAEGFAKSNARTPREP